MANPSLGMHVLTKASNQLYGNDGAERLQHVDIWHQMGVTDLKLLTDGDSQLKSARWLVQQGFRVIVRFYRGGIATEAVPDDQIKPFRDAGVMEFEGYTNEPEIEWGRPPVPEIIEDLARAHIRFADTCGRCGVKPITPAIQGDRVYNWFEPMVRKIIDLGRKDALEGSIIGCHPRPVNNVPDALPPGFVVRSYENFDDVVVRYLGHSLDIYATEWGYEPGDSQNAEQPKINYALHSKYNVQLAQMKYRPCLSRVFYWTWLNDWFDSGWWRGDVAASLPVVRSLIEMPRGELEPEKPVIPPAPVNLEKAIRDAVKKDLNWDAFPWLTKYASQNNFYKGLLTEKETKVTVNGVTYLARAFGNVIIYCPEGHYSKEETLTIALFEE